MTAMRRFRRQHLVAMFSVCLIAIFSYVLFDMLDIDGSRLETHAQVCGLEAVIADCGEQIRVAAMDNPTPGGGGLSHAAVFLEVRPALATSRPLPTLTSHSRLVHTRHATWGEATALSKDSDPAGRPA